jgi:hypothetical protein
MQAITLAAITSATNNKVVLFIMVFIFVFRFVAEFRSSSAHTQQDLRAAHRARLANSKLTVQRGEVFVAQ